MSALLIFLGYILMWLTSTTYAARFLADNHARCTGRSVDGKRRLMDGSFATSGRATCFEWHGEGCHRADGQITAGRFAVGAAISLAWPLMIPLLASWSVANRKPTRVGLQREIARLEREAGIS